MIPDYPNPFEADPDRRDIWEILVRRDIDAFLAANWSILEGDFDAADFVAYDGSGRSNPDHWRIDFPALEAYRDEYLRQAADFTKVRLLGQSKVEFLHRTTVLRDIEIAGIHAIAHKKFDGHAFTETGAELRFTWQSLYFLRKRDGRWRITGFLGYLPNPMPQITGALPTPLIALPDGATQPARAGPVSPVLRVGGGTVVAMGGQGPFDANGQVVGATLAEQARVALENCRQALAQADATLKEVFKVTVYVGDMNEQPAFDEVYQQYFSPPYPVRTVLQTGLASGVKVQIDMLAVLPAGK